MKALILAVDDQRYFRELIAGTLSEEGFDVRTASSGEEALRILDRADFDLVLADLVMPGMNGTELVQRIKQRNPEQDVLVVTGIVDVATAVDTMKLGATDYLLKPFDRHTLTNRVAAILQNRRLETEHAQLLAENIEYIGERSLYAHGLALVSTLEIEPLARRIADSLCRETRAQGAVVWLAREDAGVLELSAARGASAVDDAPERLETAALPTPLREGKCSVLLAGGEPDAPNLLWGVLRCDGALLGVVRLSHKLEDDAFDALDQSGVERFLRFAEVAVANARHVRALQRQGLREPVTGAHSFDYFRDVAGNEIEKASHFGRRVALLLLELGPRSALARIGGDAVLHPWLAGITDQLRRLLRSIDVLAVDSNGRFAMLLPEADAVSAALLKRRALAGLEESGLFRGLADDVRPSPAAGIAVYPSDGTELDALLAVLETRIAESRASPVKTLGLGRISLASSLRALLQRGASQRDPAAPQLARLILAELGRRPRDRGILYIVPGNTLASAVRDGLESLRGAVLHTELAIISDGLETLHGSVPDTELAIINDGERLESDAPEVNWVSPPSSGELPPCLLQYGDAPAYALVCEESGNGKPALLYHSNDRDLVEHLAFRLREELALPDVSGFELGGA